MEILNEGLDKVTGGAGKEFQFTCPYCNIPVPMGLEEERVTCFRCKRIVLDMTRIHSKKKKSGQ